MSEPSLTRSLVRAFGPRLPMVSAARGAWDPTPLVPDGTGVGLIVTDGLLVREVRIAGMATIELLGPGDLFEAGHAADQLLVDEERFEVPEHATIAAVGALGAAALVQEPQLAQHLLSAAIGRTRRQLRHRAAVQLPRVEDRLLAVLWLVAERFGRVTDDGVDIGLELRHEQLGRLVGARRPTVTTAIALLCERGLLVRPEGRRLLLEPSSRRALGDPVAA